LNTKTGFKQLTFTQLKPIILIIYQVCIIFT